MRHACSPHHITQHISTLPPFLLRLLFFETAVNPHDCPWGLFLSSAFRSAAHHAAPVEKNRLKSIYLCCVADCLKQTQQIYTGAHRWVHEVSPVYCRFYLVIFDLYNCCTTTVAALHVFQTFAGVRGAAVGISPLRRSPHFGRQILHEFFLNLGAFRHLLGDIELVVKGPSK